MGIEGPETGDVEGDDVVSEEELCILSKPI